MDLSRNNLLLQIKVKLQALGLVRGILIALGILFCLLIGISGFFIASPYAPLIVGAAFIGLAVTAFFIRKPIWAVYAGLFFIFLPIGLIPPTIQSNINRVLSIGAFGVWLIDVAIHRRRIVWDSTMWAMLGFLTWAAISFIWSNDMQTSVSVIQVYILRFLFFLLVIPNLIREKKDVEGLLRTLAIIGWFLIIISVGFMLFTGGYTPGTRLKVLDSNQNTLGIVLLLGLPGVLWHSVQSSQQTRSGLRAYGPIVFIMLSIILTFLTGSRGSTISLGITLLIFYFFRPTRYWAKISMLVLVAALIVAPLAFTTIIDRFMVTQGDTVLGGRETIWQAGLMLIRDHIWLGVGLGNSPVAVLPYLRYFQSLFTFSQVQQEVQSPLHNPVLVILAELGLPGLLLFFTVFGTAIWSFLKRFYQAYEQNDQYMLPYCALIFAVVVGYMASWIKGGGMESDYSYYLVMALLLIPTHVNMRPAYREG